MTIDFDVAVVGAGIIGLAHAYHLARRGRRVIVFERHRRAQGASIRNFGMLWPIGQPIGPRYQLALRSLAIWQEVLQAAGLWHDRSGSLHLAYHDDEAEVLREFIHLAGSERPGCRLLAPAEIGARFPAVRPDGLRAGLFSSTEVLVDPRQVIAALPDWLAQTYGVRFEFATTVLGYEQPHVHTASGTWKAHHLIVCTGADYQELFPHAFAEAGLVACKLQMMRTQPFGDRFRLGAMLAAGLTLRHYPCFAICPSLAALNRRLDAELPEYGQYGIHVLAAQGAEGELILGDSHEYGTAIEPFDKPYIDELILTYLQGFLACPELRIAARWHGIYVKHPTEPWVVTQPRPGATAVVGVGGAGMTLSFGLAEQTIDFLE